MQPVINHFLQPRWFVVGAIVGSALNIINQGDAIFGGKEVNFAKICLTFAVPYLVSSISAWYSRPNNDKT